MNEAINSAHGKLRSLRASLKEAGNSSWEGEDLGIYVYENDGKYTLSSPFPADVDGGRFINPDGNTWAGTSATLDVDQANVAAVVVNEVGGSWRGPEIYSRDTYLYWSKSIKGPVSVSINNGGAFYRARWRFDSNGCSASGYKGAGKC